MATLYTMATMTMMAMYDVIMTNEDNGVYDEDGDVLADGDHNVTDAVTLSASASLCYV